MASASPSPSAPRRSARARRPPPRLDDSAMASTPARRRTARARRPLPQAAGRAVASTSARARRRSGRGPAAQIVLPEEIWEDIFLRLDAVTDLARASAACSPFRRIISDRRFLRRFRSLHPPPVLGFICRDSYGYQEFLPAEPPHRSAPQALPLVKAADFTFSFLPEPSEWRIRHASDGRVLLARRISTLTQFKDFVVCDPLHRRYVMIPRMPDDLMASAPTGANHLLPFLAPAGESDEEESIRVICAVLFEDKAMAFVFSSCNQTWRGIISTICLPNGFLGCMPCYVHGCLYWMSYGMGNSLMLDTSEMRFSVIDLPPHNFKSTRAIVAAEEGRLGFLTIGDDTINLYCKNWQSNGVVTEVWQHDRMIPLPKESARINYLSVIEGTAGHYLALLGSRQISRELRKFEYFILDTKTLFLEKVCVLRNLGYSIPYARFPPPFALPCI